MNIRRIVYSFADAYRGVRYVWHQEQNFRLQSWAAFFVLSLAITLHVGKIELLVLLLLIAMVLLLEILNTAMEHFIDVLKPRLHHQVGVIKDIMAAAVLCGALSAGIIGIVIFYPYIRGLF
ncbi:MAG: diacylglycerol kinase [Candidatus Magasanikbacteria bacterium]|uniref:Diacylglycerol kinase n=1 Tax=Candidatus Magasanikbacteria bacterium CG10_big_fil_rev_8_21_14_0_10_38_6 TaxID=1974647 RepID=A0A2M6P245_9BACT|nr:diacylglycerol kinase [Candidatus Magasanikbacteria bacterium]NCS99737.1 diacylglycerol kinase [Candidatus Parcubacteria bacterium]PIR77786.1 MAG: diacylglycerol kinase [Candidatus Magasanikbacteria bacterium CG10_big_fil_rev_8_21_14_0_10_38_6]